MPYPDDENQPTDLREFFGVLRRRKWSVILPTLLVVGVALASVAQRTALFSSTARVEVLPKTAEATLLPSYGNTFMNMDTEAARVTSTQVQARAADLLATGWSPALAADAGVSVSVPANTTYLDITCTTEQAAAAQACAQAYADAYVADRKAVVDLAVADLRQPFEAKIAGLSQKIAALDAQIAATTDPETRALLVTTQTRLQGALTTAQVRLDSVPRPSDTPAEVAIPAGLPTQPSNKDYVTTGILAGIVGLALGIGLAFLRQRMDVRVGENEGLDTVLGTPVLAVVPHVGGRRRSMGSAVIALSDPESAAAEAYRSARPVLLHRASEHDAKTILVTGPGQGEGKSTTTANLGVVLARSGYRVALLSCDLRKPTLHRLFGLASEPGLADVLQHHVALRDALLRTGVPNLVVLPSGVSPPNPSELLGSGAMAAIVAELRANADFVLLDSPPSLVVADALELAPVVDGILVVVDGSRTTQADVSRLRAQLDQVGGHLLGCVLNNFDRKAASRYGSYYSASYRYAGNGSNGGRRKEDRERGDSVHPGSFPRGASDVNVDLGPAPIEGFDVRPNGNGKVHAPDESVPEAVAEPLDRPDEAAMESESLPEPPVADTDMWR